MKARSRKTRTLAAKLGSYVLETKGLKYIVGASDRFGAYRKFFNLIVDGKITLDKVGHIVSITENGEQYPFRIVPTLYHLGILDEETALENLALIAGGFSASDLKKMAIEDAKTLGFCTSRGGGAR